MDIWFKLTIISKSYIIPDDTMFVYVALKC